MASNRRAIDGLPEKLLKFSQNYWGEEALLKAWEDFTLSREGDFSPDTPHMQLFIPWFFFNWRPDYSIPDADTSRKKTTGEALLGKHGRGKVKALLRDFEIRNADSNLLADPSVLDELRE